jgi:hypothetical protein
MTPWQTLPQSFPPDGEKVWVRTDQWFGTPYLAFWDLAGQQFLVVDTDLVMPWWRVARWRLQD